MRESDAREVAAPAASDGDTAHDGGDTVAEGLPHVEAFVAVLPHAVDAVRVVGLAKHILKAHLVGSSGAFIANGHAMYSTALTNNTQIGRRWRRQVNMYTVENGWLTSCCSKYTT